MTDTEKVGPVDHITRGVLPWRTGADQTQCGKPVTSLVGRLVTREEAMARIKRIGQQRAAFTLCMTCASTSDRHSRYLEMDDAVAAVARHVSAASRAWPPDGRRSTAEWEERQRLNVEFEAISALISAHRDEFAEYLFGREQTVSLADRRRQRRA
jgi:hypothetical protein